MSLDTLDLQDHDAPSAKDHTKQPTHPSPYGYGPAAPHQQQALRHAEHEAYQQQHTSPRSSEDRPNGGFHADQHFYDDLDDDRDDDHMTSQNGVNGNGYHGQDLDDGAGDSHDEEDMDDDLMDKISSSPSIEDGKYSLPIWPTRVDSVDLGASPASPTPTRGSHSSSPFSVTPDHFPLYPTHVIHPASHHGEYSTQNIVNTDGHLESFTPNEEYGTSRDPMLMASDPVATTQYYNIPLSESQEFRRYLLPTHDPLLDDAIESYEDDFVYEENEDDWEDEASYLPDYASSSDDDTEDFTFSLDDRFVDSGWGGECLREIEDIDFEFVYALHTFVATVEGQANATKGDTMVLLDDSNSYWWLVRVVKDGSIVRKLSASMLGDNTEKSKNPLKKAMRRRNAKTVQFTAPTYYEPSDYEYSDEEDEEGDDVPLDGSDDRDDTESAEDQQDLSGTTEPRSKEETVIANGIQRMTSNESLKNEVVSSPTKSQQVQVGLEQPSDEPMQRSRKGVVRNTDSFYRDETVETKKISLTPRLLRGDADAASAEQQQQQHELRQRASLETFDKIVGSDEKSKDKKKEKKGMLSGLFKRKKGSTPEESEKLVEEQRQSPQSKDSLESLTSRPEAGPERKPSKLQKNPPPVSPKASGPDQRAPSREGVNTSQAPVAGTGLPATAPASASALSTVRKVESEPTPGEGAQEPPSPSQAQSATPVNRFPSLTEKRSIFSPITTALKPSSNTTTDGDGAVKTIYSKRAKERFALEDSDSEDEKNAVVEEDDRKAISPISDSQAAPSRSDSAMQVSPIEPSDMYDDLKYQTQQQQGAIRISPIHDEPALVESEGTASTSKPSPSTATHTPSTSRSTPTWSDASLRSYMENSQDIKDLLIIVHDKSNVTPVGPEHPLMQDLFSAERNKLAEMQAQLDNMLMGWISKKNSSLLSGAI
ncbi:protein phosphatase regulator [Exophiala oligosperma]